MKTHPIAALYPALDKDHLAKLADSIRISGQLHPIITLDGEILDGRCRWEACKSAKVEPTTKEYRGKKDWASLVAYVQAANEHRRHLSPSQLAVVAYKLTKLTPTDCTKSSTGQRTAAKIQGVSLAIVEQASKVVQNSPAPIVKAVEAGEVKVSDAVAVLELSSKEQLAALTKKRKGEAKTLKQAATDFNPATFKPAKTGKQKRSPADRKNAFLLLGKLVRALDRLGLSADLDTELKAINRALKES